MSCSHPHPPVQLVRPGQMLNHDSALRYARRRMVRLLGDEGVWPPSVHRRLQAHRQRTDPARYAPCATVNQALGELVRALQGQDLSASDQHLVGLVDLLSVGWLHGHPQAQPRAIELREIASAAERALELHYAPRLAQDPASSSPLAPFPYLGNYERLIETELPLLAGAQHILVAGAGPAPLTGLLLHRKTGARITLVDADPIAVRLAASLVDRLEDQGFLRPEMVGTVCANIADHCVASEVDTVLVASLVDDAAKVAVAKRLAVTHARVRLLLRSAHGLCGQLAYAPTPRHAVEGAGMQFLGQVVPRTRIVPEIYGAQAQAWGGLTVRDPSIISVASSDILNSTELYVPRREAF